MVSTTNEWMNLPITSLWVHELVIIHRFHLPYRPVREKPFGPKPNTNKFFVLVGLEVINLVFTRSVLTRSILAPGGGVAFCSSCSSWKISDNWAIFLKLMRPLSNESERATCSEMRSFIWTPLKEWKRENTTFRYPPLGGRSEKTRVKFNMNETLQNRYFKAFALLKCSTIIGEVGRRRKKLGQFC